VTDVPVRTEVLMGTLVTIHVVRPGADDAIERAFGWFREIEARCSRFDEQSELVQLTTRVGVPVPRVDSFEASGLRSPLRKIPTARLIRPSVITWKRAASAARIAPGALSARRSPDGDVSYRDVSRSGRDDHSTPSTASGS
jgi:hypothetical protein